MIDEIELVDSDVHPEKVKKAEEVTIDIVFDARSRYRKAVIDRWNSKQRDGGDKRLEIIGPWEKHPRSTAKSLDEVERIEASGDYLGLIVKGYEKLSVSLKAGQASKQLGLYSVSQVLTAAEEFIYDPLYMVASAVGLAVNNETFFLIDLSSIDQKAKSSKLVIKTWRGDERKYKELTIAFGNQEVRENCMPFAINLWTYSDDQPIWSDKEKIRDYLEGLGDYVAVISPRTLGIGSVPVATQIARLKQELKFYRNSKHILVYLAWDKLYAKGVDKPSVVEWVKQAQEVAFELGIDGDRWALYPVDEVNRERYPLLLDPLQVIKAATPDLQTFANPILPATRSNKLSLDQLQSLNDYLAIWQPELQLAALYNKFFLESRKLFWVYKNPEYPAKSTSPEWYYDLPQRAQGLGASGVGFWSFSDTSKTSAWDDLDGRRADWAVFYESKNAYGELVLSRRWLAFLAGIKEVRLLRCSP